MSCGPHPSVLSVAFSGDGRTLAAGCMSGPVRLVDVASGKEKETVGKNWNPAWAVSFTPDGQKLLAGINDGAVEIWHLADHKEGGALTTKRGYVTSLVFTPDGKKLITGHGNIYNDSDIPGVIGIWDFP